MTLFSGRMDILISKVERQLLIQSPLLDELPENDIVLSFLLWGASHVLIESNYEETVQLDTLNKVAKQIIISLDVQRDGESI